MRRLLSLLVVAASAIPGMAVATTSAASAAPSSTAAAADLVPPKKMGTVEVATRLRASTRKNAVIPGAMSYHGGTISTTVTPVYLVIWGSDWGTQSQNLNGYDTFSNDPQNIVPLLESMYSGIGHNGERWSAVATQYCSGAAYGATSCALDNASRVAYPIHGVFDLSHVFYDNASPYGADNKVQLDVRNEAHRAQVHFNSPADAQYVVLTPQGTHPAGFLGSGGFCGWHAWSTTYNFSYTLLPYIPDAGTSCGANTFGPNRPNDGVTATAGHEYQETITDLQLGWVDQLGRFDSTGWYDDAGWENGDKCAWINSGPGAMAQVTLSTGTFVQQSEWSNSANACVMTQNTVEGGSGTTLADPGTQNAVVGHTFSLALGGAVSDGGTLSYDAGDLPAGLAVDASSGVISGVPTTAGTATAAIQAKSTTGATTTVFVSFAVAQIPVALANPGTTKATMGRSFSLQPVATVLAGTPLFSATNLPAWAHLDTTTGQISGIPDALGTTSVTVTATADGQSDSITFDLIVGGQVNVTAITPKNFIAGKAASIQILATDSASGTMSFAAAGLPDGLTIDPASGLISGSATTVSTGTATVTVHGGEDITTPFTWSVVAPTITATSPLSIQVLPGKATTVKLRATSNSGLPVRFAPLNSYATSNCGLTLASDGSFTGTSTNWGDISLSCDGWLINATDGYGTTTLTVAVVVAPVIVNVNPADSTHLFTGKAASIRMVGKATSNKAVTYAASGLPAGVTINATTGVLSGAPTRTGNFTAWITARSGSLSSTKYRLAISVVRPSITLSVPSNATARRGQATTLTISAVDSAGEKVTYSVTGLPAGLSINAGTGVISGKPKSSVALSSYTVTVSASDPGGAAASGTMALQITT